jgi:hypothetical protein
VGRDEATPERGGAPGRVPECDRASAPAAPRASTAAASPSTAVSASTTATGPASGPTAVGTASRTASDAPNRAAGCAAIRSSHSTALHAAARTPAAPSNESCSQLFGCTRPRESRARPCAAPYERNSRVWQGPDAAGPLAGRHLPLSATGRESVDYGRQLKRSSSAT